MSSSAKVASFRTSPRAMAIPNSALMMLLRMEAMLEADVLSPQVNSAVALPHDEGGGASHVQQFAEPAPSRTKPLPASGTPDSN
jgi:hypothetical protein